jgi:DNA-binding GntR family transcriptional regulator
VNSGFTSERVYGALKRRLLAGEFRPGDRLDPALLSDTLSSSVTPVRDVLNILRGEGLVETRTGEGFFRPQITAPDLQDMYAWEDQVLTLAVRHWRTAPDVMSRPLDATIAERTATLFQAIADWSPNAEHGRCIAGVNDRLYAVREVEALILDATVEELGAMELALQDHRELGRLISAYHRRRQRAASDIVRAIYRSG